MRPLIGAVLFLCVGIAVAQSAPKAGLRFEISLPSAAGDAPFTGHLILAISKDPKGEPRFQIDESLDTQQAFGVDVENLPAGGHIVVDELSFGYPLRHLSELPVGDYSVQAVFNKYETYHLIGGRTLELPPDKGEGQHWNTKPGNPMNAPTKLHLDPHQPQTYKITLDKTIPALPPSEADTKLLKHIQIKSEMLSKFWGRDIYLGAIILLPAGWEEHPDARYPVVVWQDHFRAKFGAPMPYRETPPPADLKGTAKHLQQYSYRFYQDWTNGTLPHVILVLINHANPYYDDSYAVNSANLGPYGDAITQEVIPEIERRYRGIGQGWARATYGGSTGGWEALASQVFYPDFYNGAWSFCPDPVDFHAYQVTDLYKDANAYYHAGPFEQVPIPSDRKGDGNVTADMDQVNHYEFVLGTKGRSGEQYDVWQAVYSPVGADGYPKPIYDKVTGTVNKDVADFWKQHYDLDAILMRDWPTLGAKLEGKLHIAVGLSDTFYLNNAVHLLQQDLETTQHPHSDATFDYGPWQPHCFSGTLPDWDESKGLDLNERVLPLMVKHMLATAPQGSDVSSWRY